MASKNDKAVKELAAQFADANDVLNRAWVAGDVPERLQKYLAQTASGTNDTTDIIARMLNDGISMDFIKNSLTIPLEPDQYNWPFTGQGNGPRPANHTGMAKDNLSPNYLPGGQGEDLPRHPQQTIGLHMPIPINQPASTKPDLGHDKNATTGTGTNAPGLKTTVVQAPGDAGAKLPKTPAEVEKFIRQKYGSYSWMLDDPAFGEVRKVLQDSAKQGLDEQATTAALKNTAWWKSLDDDQRKWDIDEKTQGTTIVNKIAANVTALRAAASKMGVELSDQRLTELAREMGRNNWTEIEIQGALAGEAQYKEGYNWSGDIGAWQEKAKGLARDYLSPITDQAAFDWAKKAAGGLVDEDNMKSYFTQQAIALLPEYSKQLQAGVTARSILNPQIGTIANLLEIGEDNVDLVNDPRFTNVISNPDKKVMSVSETAKLVKSTDDYWKTGNANKEVSGMVNGLARSFGKLA